MTIFDDTINQGKQQLLYHLEDLSLTSSDDEARAFILIGSYVENKLTDVSKLLPFEIEELPSDIYDKSKSVFEAMSNKMPATLVDRLFLKKIKEDKIKITLESMIFIKAFFDVFTKNHGSIIQNLSEYTGRLAVDYDGAETPADVANGINIFSKSPYEMIAISLNYLSIQDVFIKVANRLDIDVSRYTNKDSQPWTRNDYADEVFRILKRTENRTFNLTFKDADFSSPGQGNSTPIEVYDSLIRILGRDKAHIDRYSQALAHQLDEGTSIYIINDLNDADETTNNELLSQFSLSVVEQHYLGLIIAESPSHSLSRFLALVTDKLSKNPISREHFQREIMSIVSNKVRDIIKTGEQERNGVAELILSTLSSCDIPLHDLHAVIYNNNIPSVTDDVRAFMSKIDAQHIKSELSEQGTSKNKTPLSGFIM